MSMQMIQASHAKQNLTVVGFRPDGASYRSTVMEATPFEAKMGLLADFRYAEDGGDLSISCVLDTSTGRLLDQVGVSSEEDLFDEVEAVDTVLAHAAQGGRRYRMKAYLSFFEFVLSDMPEVFVGLVGGSREAGEDLAVQYEDVDGKVFEFLPSQALLVLAEKAMKTDRSGASLQVKKLAERAGVALDRAIAAALG
ncbi:hypothetical protein [Noviherbaspirillum pedocola]|uniref:Uncharacterized protein n=1 Tax=Noviherbaspirillum pedocola TaxID=2801341 RepID=A0A934T0V6_9BURK|nr:hypothetical protein [Noviherbaspirillum pedocola]MBK4738666.1 hypothetical protein [Noviherbaspirillum pedocola]